MIESNNPDSRWLKKGKKYFFGYKGFVAVDEEHGYVNKVYVTPANVAEVNQLEHILEDIKAKRIYGDKRYTSQDNKRALKNAKLKDGLMHKAVRGKKLSQWQKIKNKLISKKRFIVEQCFGTLKTRFYFHRASYLRLQKVQAQFYFKAMCFNLLKGANMVKIA